MQFRFPLDVFKPLFLETWQYYIDLASHGTMNCKDLYPYMVMAKILGNNCYPSEIPNWEYAAAMQFIERLLESIADGTVTLGTWPGGIDSFEEDFTQLCSALGENFDSDDGQNID